MKNPIRAVLLGLTFSAVFLAQPVLFSEPVVLTASFNPAAGPNQYAVNFPPELGSSQIIMPIVGGSFELETDREAGTSRIVTWRQDISPIDIFGFSTGPIAITIVPEDESVGTLDAETGEFSVAATFRIDFDDSELAQVGFVSPVELRGTEEGRINGVGSIGTVGMFLEGEGLFGGGTFSYTCQTTASFDYLLRDDQAQPGDVNHDRELNLTDSIGIVGSLFQGLPVRCPMAREVNQDAQVDLSDAVFLLNYLFIGGAATPADPVACDSVSEGS